MNIKWKSDEGWHVFPLADINHMPRNHAINLFSGNIQVVAKERDTYIVNRPEMQKQYQSKGHTCKLFCQLEPNEQPLMYCGLI